MGQRMDGVYAKHGFHGPSRLPGAMAPVTQTAASVPAIDSDAAPFSEPTSAAEKKRIAANRRRMQDLLKTGAAIEKLSWSDCPSSEIFKQASRWNPQRMDPSFVAPYLSRYGYEAADEKTWLQAPTQSVGSPQLRLGVERHFEEAGHTWYVVECSFKLGARSFDGEPEHFRWEAPRRLVQLRAGLYEHVKCELGQGYKKHFGSAPFARRAGMSGSTARLKSWLLVLASLVREGTAPPSVVAHALRFFRAPGPSLTIAKAGDGEEETPGLAATWAAAATAGGAVTCEQLEEQIGAVGLHAGLGDGDDALVEDKDGDGHAQPEDEEIPCEDVDHQPSLLDRVEHQSLQAAQDEEKCVESPDEQLLADSDVRVRTDEGNKEEVQTLREPKRVSFISEASLKSELVMLAQGGEGPRRDEHPQGDAEPHAPIAPTRSDERQDRYHRGDPQTEGQQNGEQSPTADKLVATEDQVQQEKGPEQIVQQQRQQQWQRQHDQQEQESQQWEEVGQGMQAGDHASTHTAADMFDSIDAEKRVSVQLDQEENVGAPSVPTKPKEQQESSRLVDQDIAGSLGPDQSAEVASGSEDRKEVTVMPTLAHPVVAGSEAANAAATVVEQSELYVTPAARPVLPEADSATCSAADGSVAPAEVATAAANAGEHNEVEAAQSDDLVLLEADSATCSAVDGSATLAEAMPIATAAEHSEPEAALDDRPLVSEAAAGGCSGARTPTLPEQVVAKGPEQAAAP